MCVLSFIVPLYRVEAYIEKCLESIIGDENFLLHCELILVDDGSPDKSAEIAERLCRGLPNVTLIRQANMGLGGARNSGVAVARGKYLWFVDSDDWLPTNGISHVLNALHDCDVEILNIDHVTSTGLHCPTAEIEPSIIYSGIDYLSKSIIQSPVQYYIFNREFYTRKGLRFELGRYHEDALFTPIAVSQSTSIVRLASPCYVYNVREGSIMTGGNNLKHFLDTLFVMQELHAFCEGNISGPGARDIFSKYVALCTSGLYYYWRKLSSRERKSLAPKIDIKLICQYLFAAKLYKYFGAVFVFLICRLSSMRFSR